MNTDILRETEKFEQLSAYTQKDGAVFMGSTFWASIPVSELSQDLSIPVYNRSIRGIRISEAEPLIDPISRMEPARIFVGIGDADLESSDFDINIFLSAYEWLLYTLHSRCKALICITSVVSQSPHTPSVNSALRRLAAETGCVFVDIPTFTRSSSLEVRAFEAAKRHFIRHTPQFTDIMFNAL